MGVTVTSNELEDAITDRILQGDIDILNEHGCADRTIALMAAEHAARTERLAQMIEPSLGRSVLLLTAAALLEVVKGIDAVTFREPELVNLPI
jgi:penicillin V acylase-like amidase (Ntn superfamily)